MSTDLILFPKANASVPAFMKEDANAGVEELGKFIRPPRLKVVQPQTDSEMYDCAEGSVLAVPQNIQIAGMNSKREGEAFHVVPLLFFPEWCCWNPFAMKGVLPMIRERTFDAKSPVALKAQNPDLWSESCPEKPDDPTAMLRYVEHLNFVCLVAGGAIPGIPIVISFSKTNHRTGSNFAALLRLRQAPIYGCVFEMRTVFHNESQGQWYTLAVSNPDEEKCGVSPFVQDPEVFAQLRELHTELKAAKEASQLEVIHEDEEQDEPSVDNGEY